MYCKNFFYLIACIYLITIRPSESSETRKRHLKRKLGRKWSENYRQTQISPIEVLSADKSLSVASRESIDDLKGDDTKETIVITTKRKRKSKKKSTKPHKNNAGSSKHDQKLVIDRGAKKEYIGMQVYPNFNEQGDGSIKINKNGLDFRSLDTIFMYNNDSMTMVHNKTHYAILSKPVRYIRDIRQLWEKQKSVQMFDSSPWPNKKLPLWLENLKKLQEQQSNFPWTKYIPWPWNNNFNTKFERNVDAPVESSSWSVPGVISSSFNWIWNKWQLWNGVQESNNENSIANFKSNNIKTTPKKIIEKTSTVKDIETNTFTELILNRSLKLIKLLLRKTRDSYFRNQIKQFAEKYKQRFDKFIRSTRRKDTKTNLSPREVILYTIFMSNNVIKRLHNLIFGDLTNNGMSRRSSNSKTLDKEIEKEIDAELKEACLKFDVCSKRDGFINFITDLMKIILTVDDKKFKQLFNSLVSAVLDSHYDGVLTIENVRSLNKKINSIKHQDLANQKALVMISHNIIAKRTIPMIFNEGSNDENNNFNATTAFSDIVYILDKKVTNNDDNMNEWYNIKMALQDWAKDEPVDIKVIVHRLMTHVKPLLDKTSLKEILDNFKIILA